MQWAFFCFRRLDRVYNLPPGPRKPEPKQPPLVLTLRFWAFVPKLQLVGWSEQVKDKVSGRAFPTAWRMRKACSMLQLSCAIETACVQDNSLTI